MSTIDNSKIFLEGIYSDASVKVPAKTTYVKGLVLGRNADGDLAAFDSSIEGSEPLYILATNIQNESESADEYLVRVFEGGAVNREKIVFTKPADASNNEVLDAMKRNGFMLELVTEMTQRTSLA